MELDARFLSEFGPIMVPRRWYQTSSRYGPTSECITNNTLSLDFDTSINVMFLDMPLRAKTATPPPFRPSFLSLRATRLYASSVKSSVEESRNVSLKQTSAGAPRHNRNVAVSSARWLFAPCTFTEKVWKLSSLKSDGGNDVEQSDDALAVRDAPRRRAVIERGPRRRNRGQGFVASPSVSLGSGALSAPTSPGKRITNRGST